MAEKNAPETPARLVFIHTVSLLIPLFTRLAGELLPGVPLTHILDEPALERVRRRGGLAPEDAERLRSHVELAREVGAGAVLVTCSTLSPCVDEVRPWVSLPLFKIDEAMIAQAVAIGGRIGVAATNPTTLEPTRRSLLSQAAGLCLARELEVELCLVEGALAALLAGDNAAHDGMVRAAARDLATRSDVVVLAQASMARALEAMPEAERLAPILSSPHMALAQVRQFMLCPSRPGWSYKEPSL